MPAQKAIRETAVQGRRSLILEHQGPSLLLRVFSSPLQQYRYITGKLFAFERILSFPAASAGSYAEGLMVSYTCYAFWD
jgi:hypothetical protein